MGNATINAFVYAFVRKTNRTIYAYFLTHRPWNWSDVNHKLNRKATAHLSVKALIRTKTSNREVVLHTQAIRRDSFEQTTNPATLDHTFSITVDDTINPMSFSFEEESYTPT